MNHTLNDTSNSASQTADHHGLNNETNSADIGGLTHNMDMTNTTNQWTDSPATTATGTTRQPSPNSYYSLAEDALSEETLLALGIDIIEIRAQQEIERRLKEEADQLEYAKRLQLVYNMESISHLSSASTSTPPVTGASNTSQPMSPALPVRGTQPDRDALVSTVTNDARSVQPNMHSPNMITSGSSSNTNSTDQRNNKRKTILPTASSSFILIPSSPTSSTQNGKRPRYDPMPHVTILDSDHLTVSDSDSDSNLSLDSLPSITTRPNYQPSSSQPIPSATTQQIPSLPASHPTKTPLALREEQVLSDLQSSLGDDHYTATTPIATSTDLKIELLGYQKNGYHWMCQQEETDIKGGLLADDVGLGKTIQTLALITGRRCVNPDPLPSSSNRWSSYPIAPTGSFKIKTSLIVCPPSLMEQWYQEIKTKTQNISVHIHHGEYRSRNVRKLAGFDVIITSYGLMISEFVGRTTNETPPLSPLIFHRIILDEAHTLENPTSELARACFSARSTYRWCLTATPIQSKLRDLQSLVQFLNFKPYCDALVFRKAVLAPSGSGQPVVDIIRSILKSICLRRTKNVLTGDLPMLTLPPKEEHIIRGDFSTAERLAYDLVQAAAEKQFKLYVGYNGVIRQYSCVLALLTNLRQTCLHTNVKSSLPAITQTQESICAKNARQILPSVVNRLRDLKEKSETLECPICMDTAVDPRILPECGHIFCHECMLTYANSCYFYGNQTCPECRSPLCHERAVPVNTFIRVHLSALPSTESTQLEQPLDGNNGAKINLTLDILKKAREQSDGDDKTIIFTEYQFMMGRLYNALKAHGYNCVRFDSSIDITRRAKVLRQFVEDKTLDVLLMSTKTGSVGLNLTMANHVILTDVGWNSAMEDQAVGRVHRLGQTKPVHIHRLFINDTVEDRVFELHEKRKQMAASAFGGSGSTGSNRLGVQEMKYLICGGVSPFYTTVAGPST